MQDTSASRPAAGHGRRTARARAPAAKLGTVIWASLRGLVAPTTWSRVGNVTLSAVAGAAFFVALVVGLVVSAAFSWIVGVGSTSCTATLRLGAKMARFDQRRLARFVGEHLELPPLPQPPEGQRRHERSRAWLRSPAAWRLLAYELVRLPVAGAAALLVFGWWRLIAQVLGWWPNLSPRSVVRLGPIALAIACVVAWPYVVRVASSLDLLLARWLLAPSRTGQLSAEVERLGTARSEAVAAADAERHRIERDLHDGLQPRLVSLAVDLGLAEVRFDRDPDASRSLVSQAHRQAKTVIEELRGIVRGIHPSVLDGRGLDAALSALVGSCAIPVDLRVELGERLAPIQEAAAYYVVAESITNAQKHSGADQITVEVRQDSDELIVRVEDTGNGGAKIEAGGGLAGLAARVRSLDGTFAISSPPGGPTRVEAVIPCGR